ncbi:uncharacterized protein J3D65DRAFT_624835 [Phyllosticta citribraziliensis]|uniref:Uncharacterized protein n=1 Tax=Phyllosticta citribraziliensis TaxID=989973 RepID=A0ABR1LPX9_9PEZI
MLVGVGVVWFGLVWSGLVSQSCLGDWGVLDACMHARTHARAYTCGGWILTSLLLLLLLFFFSSSCGSIGDYTVYTI